MNEPAGSRTRAIYAAHPLSRASILARIARQGLDVQTLTEWNLAIDPRTDITDQNHAGGVQSVLELASLAAATGTCTVVDIGAGLGGSARVLAATLGCHVLAVENDPLRHADATALTASVHLDQYVTHLEVDAAGACPADTIGKADILWGQSAWVHFAHPEQFLDNWLPALTSTGRVAMCDSHLSRPPATEEERALVQSLEYSWGARLTTSDRWIRHLTQSGFRLIDHADRSQESLLHFRRLEEVSRLWPPGMLTEFEATGWARAIAALENGLIRSERIVASR